MVRTQIYLPDPDHRALRRVAKAEGVSMTELVRRLVAEYTRGRRGIAAFPKEAILSFVALDRCPTDYSLLRRWLATCYLAAFQEAPQRSRAQFS